MIRYFTEDITFQLKEKRKVSKWVKETVASESFKLGDINYIFCSDEYLLNVNKQYLNHNYYTDIITFDNTEDENKISGDIFISIDRVKENAMNHKFEFDEELRRVLIHGILHLCGYKDKTPKQKKEMRNKENFYLSKFS